MHRGFVDTPKGQIHYRTAGEGKSVLLLHQTPRSSAEFLGVIPLLAKSMRVVAMDTIGYGDSYKPSAASSIEDYARGAIELLDGLKIEKTSLVGHHTGAFLALEMAASYPKRIEKLVLSNASYYDQARRELSANRPPIDEVEFQEDGSHLFEMWNRRRGFYPTNRPDLLMSYVIDALKAGEKIEEGHEACARYRMEDKVGLVKCATLLVCGTEDPYAFPYQEVLKAKIENSTFKPIEGGMVPLPDQMPEEYVQAILPFLTDH
jgi:pimeloyl-ACP methyl ester carboxylesterase